MVGRALLLLGYEGSPAGMEVRAVRVQGLGFPASAGS
jgi:hypothetical protein